MNGEKQPYLEFQNIGKTFAGVVALNGISFGCHEGAVHALMGENGAGKSTLLKILAGNYAPSSGHIALNGQAQHFQSTAAALAQGVPLFIKSCICSPKARWLKMFILGSCRTSAAALIGRSFTPTLIES